MNIYGEVKQIEGKVCRGIAMSESGQLVMFFEDGYQLIVSGDFSLSFYHLVPMPAGGVQ